MANARSMTLSSPLKLPIRARKRGRSLIACNKRPEPVAAHESSQRPARHLLRLPDNRALALRVVYGFPARLETAFQVFRA